MKIKVENIEFTRLICFSIVATSLLLYALLCLSGGTTRPFYWWLPAALGLASTAALFALSFLAGRSIAAQAWDELYHATSRKAAARAYWVSLVLFAAFGVSAAFGIVQSPVGIAAFGTLMGASYLIFFVYLDWRAGR